MIVGRQKRGENCDQQATGNILQSHSMKLCLLRGRADRLLSLNIVVFDDLGVARNLDLDELTELLGAAAGC